LEEISTNSFLGIEVGLTLSVPGAQFLLKILKSLQCHTLPAARVREVFKPSMDSTSLVPEIEKKNLGDWVWRFPLSTSQ